MTKIIKEDQLDFNNLLIRPQKTSLISRSDVDIETTYKSCNCKYSLKGTFIINANMGAFSSKVVKCMIKNNMFGLFHKWENIDFLTDFYYKAYLNNENINNIFFTCGTRKEDFENIKLLYSNLKNKMDLQTFNIRIDTPNGYTSAILDTVKKVKDLAKDNCFIIAGNVVTSEMVVDIIKSGASGVVVGIGSGNQCSTRVKTGVGRPQASAVLECSKIAHKHGGLLISDGGIKSSGDICKAFGLGADGVMIGSMFGGVDETVTDIVEKNGKKYKIFFGSASNTCMNMFYKNKKQNYRAEEGITSLLPYSGSLNDFLGDIKGGIRSLCTFIDAKNISEISKKAVFYKVSQQISRIDGALIQTQN